MMGSDSQSVIRGIITLAVSVVPTRVSFGNLAAVKLRCLPLFFSLERRARARRMRVRNKNEEAFK